MGCAHLFLLAKAVGPGLGLQVNLRVPVCVVHDDAVSCLQVQPHAAGARAQQKHAQAAAGVIEPAHLPATARSIRYTSAPMVHADIMLSAMCTG